MIYLKDKSVDIACLHESYSQKVDDIKSEEETVLFFEYLLDEFYDSHLILNTNRNSSFRLYSPIYAKTENEKTVITNVWQTQLKNLTENILGAEILKFNQKDFSQVIDQFPTVCNDKQHPEVREWIANKILAGRYNEPRILTLKLKDIRAIELNLDELQIKQEKGLLSVSINDETGIIRINNSLGNTDLINEFDRAIDSLVETKGLILDLRNTVDGGDSYVARPIMGRFINRESPYQRHSNETEEWTEYAHPRKKQYTKPLVIVVDRWTGSMGEGLAIGFEGMGRGTIVGTEMERLPGAMQGFSFKNSSFGYRLSTEKLFHINGTPREKYVPTNFVVQMRIDEDELLNRAIEIIKKDQP